MRDVFASIQREEFVTDGAGSTTGFKFGAINVGGTGDVAISRDGGLTFVVYPAANITLASWIGISGNAIGTLAQGTTATDVVIGAWGPL